MSYLRVDPSLEPTIERVIKTLESAIICLRQRKAFWDAQVWVNLNFAEKELKAAKTLVPKRHTRAGLNPTFE